MNSGSIDTKSTFTGAVRFSTFQKDYVQPILREDMGRDIITYGADNLYPVFVKNLVRNSSTLASVLAGKADFVSGKGLVSKSGNKALNKFLTAITRKGDDFLDTWKKTVISQLRYGGFAWIVIWAKGSTPNKPKIAEINYIDLSTLRYNSKADGFLYLKNWDRYLPKLPSTDDYIPEPYDQFDLTNPRGKQIYYYAGLTTDNFYPEPSWISSITSVQADIEISNYHKSIISSGMFPNLMVTFHNGVPEEKEMEKIEKNFSDKFGGTDKAGKVVFSYSEPGQEAATITPIQENDADKKFLNLADATRDKIYAAQRASPSLFGIATAGKLGDNQQLKVSFDIFRKTVIEPVQDELLKIINRIVGINFKDADLEVIQIPALLNYFDEPFSIIANMTPNEARKVLLEMGFIDSVEIPEGETLIGWKNFPNLNDSDKALAEKNLATAESLTNGSQLPDLKDDPDIDTTGTDEPNPNPSNS
jgi:hypothetical protein